MAKRLSGKEVNCRIIQRIQEKMDGLHGQYIKPKLAIIRVGEREDDICYERNIIRQCEKLGIEYKCFCFSQAVAETELISLIGQINKDDSIHGVLLFRPLPKHLNEGKIVNTLDIEKDVDGISDGSLAAVFTGKEQGFPPCTAQSCMEFLDYYKIDCTGKKAAVVGRSLVVGKPAAMMLLNQNATVTICHTKTKDISRVTKEADIVISAVGKAGLINSSCLREGQVILDVGINLNENGMIIGDVDYESAEKIVDAITPVPGGIGSVTTSVLMEHVVDAMIRKNRGKRK